MLAPRFLPLLPFEVLQESHLRKYLQSRALRRMLEELQMIWLAIAILSLLALSQACRLVLYPPSIRRAPWPRIWHEAAERAARDAGMVLAPPAEQIKDRH